MSLMIDAVTIDGTLSHYHMEAMIYKNYNNSSIHNTKIVCIMDVDSSDLYPSSMFIGHLSRNISVVESYR